MKRRSRSSRDLTTTSIRVENSLLQRFQAVLHEQRKSMNEVLSVKIKEIVDKKDSPSHSDEPSLTSLDESELAHIFAMNIADVLKRDTTWAQTIVRSSRFSWGGILKSRLLHYAREKDFIGRVFSEFLAKRILYYLDEEQMDVTLLVDAGSTNLAVCGYLWDHLANLSGKTRSTGITILSNNVPVAEAFAQLCQIHLSVNTQVTCELLGGAIEARYGALVGSTTQRNLEQRLDKVTRRGRYIALAAGNFVRLANQRPAWPIPLIRGEGQKPIKDLYIGADEVFVPAPLGKIFLADTPEINDGFGFSENPTNPEEQAYKDVNIDALNKHVKLVTTVRSSRDCILAPHTSAVRPWLGCGVAAENSPSSLIENIGHFCYPFEEHVLGKSFADQLAIELPHKKTRRPEFRKRFYSIDMP